MASKKPATPAPDVPANGNGTAEAIPPATPADDSGVKTPPYVARWLTIRDAATRAGVTTQTVRNAYKDHPAFNTRPGDDGNPIAAPRWFATKMIDQFGNATEYDAVYLDIAAVDDWVLARADKPPTGGRNPNGPKRHVIRLTADQVAAYNRGDYAAAFDLPDGGRVALEVPTGNITRKKDDAATPADGGNDAAEVSADDAGASLFDVALTEAAS